MIRLEALFCAWDRNALRWTLSEPAPGEVVFEVWRSGNSASGFERIDQTVTLAYVDRRRRGNKFEAAYYRIEAMISGLRHVSNVVGIEAPPDDDTLRFSKRERFHLAKFIGIPALLFTKRRSGTRCPRCYDAVRGDAGVSCTICFGTGFSGGYYPPMPIYVAVEAMKAEGVNLKQEYVNETSNANLWTSNWTIVSPEDVIIELLAPNHMWYVTGVQRSQRRRSGVRQLMTVNEGDLGGPLSLLPIPNLAFPDRKELYFQDADLGRDFDIIFQEFFDEAIRTDPIPGAEGRIDFEPANPLRGPGERDPETGFFR